MKYLKLYENFNSGNKADFKLIFKVSDSEGELTTMNRETAVESLFEKEYVGFRGDFSFIDEDLNKHLFKIKVNEIDEDNVEVEVFLLQGDKNILKEGLSKSLSDMFYYDYELATKVDLDFYESIKESNHQTPDSGDVNAPGYGQGAHVGNWGVNYGNPSKGVRGHFGEKGDKTDPNLPFKQKGLGIDMPHAIYDPVEDIYLHEDEVADLLRQYDIKAKQKSEKPMTFRGINSSVIKFIRNYLKY